MRPGAYAAPYPYQMAYQKLDPEIERRALKHQAEILKSGLDSIEKRLAEIKTETAE
jgi:hypothetical protein